MTGSGKNSKGCNPIMELALTAACVAQENLVKCKLSEPSDASAPKPVTIDYIEGFHHQG